MREKYILQQKRTATFVMMVFLLAILCIPKTTKAQLTLPLFTGYTFNVNGLEPTICEASSASATSGFNYYYYFPEVTAANLSGNQATYHTAYAGKTMTVVLDIPAIGFLGVNYIMTYRYGSVGGSVIENTVYPVSNPPSGVIRFEMPVLFDVAKSQAYVSFVVKDIIGEGENQFQVGTWVVIPIAVLGPTSTSVDSLGTVLEPQIPYLILHAPPGDGSTSSFQSTQTTCQEVSSTYASDESLSANLAVKLGVKGSIGFINTVDYEFSVTMSAEGTAGDLSIQSSSDQTCVTIGQGFSTSALPGSEGNGDVFIGYGITLAYGVYEYLEVDPNTCSTRLDTGLIYAPTGDVVKFAYTKTAILSDIDSLQVKVDNTALSVKTRNDAQNQIDVWNQVLALNDENINNPNNELLDVINFSAGAPNFQESGITVAETNTIEVEHYVEGAVGLQTVLEIGGSGVSGGFEYRTSRKFGQTQNASEENSTLVRYDLNDDDEGDVFKLEVVRDPMYGTPVFRIQDGTQTSCPYQGGYQRDQPRLKHTGIENDHILLEGNAVGESASFFVDLCNESNEPRTYYLKLKATSNLNGAVVSAAGVPLNGNDQGQSFEIPGNSCIEDLVVEVSMLSANSSPVYPDLEIYLYADCQESIQSSVFASVYFGNATSVDEVENSNISKFSVSPNPSSGVINLTFDLLESAPVRFEVYDLLGRLQMERFEGVLPIGSNLQKLDLQQLAAGVYLVNIEAEGPRLMQKVIIE